MPRKSLASNLKVYYDTNMETKDNEKRVIKLSLNSEQWDLLQYVSAQLFGNDSPQSVIRALIAMTADNHKKTLMRYEKSTRLEKKQAKAEERQQLAKEISQMNEKQLTEFLYSVGFFWQDGQYASFKNGKLDLYTGGGSTLSYNNVELLIQDLKAGKHI